MGNRNNYPWQSSAVTVDVVSDDVNDDVAGTGARTLRIQGLDGSYNLGTIRIKSGRPYALIIPQGLIASAVSNSDFEVQLRQNATPSTAFSYTSILIM